jgi:hypothetical protein
MPSEDGGVKQDTTACGVDHTHCTLGARVYHPVLYLLRTKIPVWLQYCTVALLYG